MLPNVFKFEWSLVVEQEIIVNWERPFYVDRCNWLKLVKNEIIRLRSSGRPFMLVLVCFNIFKPLFLFSLKFNIYFCLPLSWAICYRAWTFSFIPKDSTNGIIISVILKLNVEEFRNFILCILNYFKHNFSPKFLLFLYFKSHLYIYVYIYPNVRASDTSSSNKKMF